MKRTCREYVITGMLALAPAITSASADEKPPASTTGFQKKS